MIRTLVSFAKMNNVSAIPAKLADLSKSECILYSGVSSSSSWRVRICLALKDIPYETVWLDSRKAQPAKGLSPMAQVPVLRIDGRNLSQSVSICEYLEETRPTGLLPSVSEGGRRAQVREIVEIINSGIQPLQNAPVLDRLPSKEFQQQWAMHFIAKGLEALESKAEQHKSGDYLFDWAETPTLAEVFLVPQIFNARRYGIVVNQNTFPRLDRVYSHLWKNHSAFEKTMPRPDVHKATQL